MTKILKLSKPVFLVTEEAIAGFVYNMKDTRFRETIEGSTIILNGQSQFTSNLLESDFLKLVKLSDTLKINFVVVNAIVDKELEVVKTEEE